MRALWFWAACGLLVLHATSSAARQVPPNQNQRAGQPNGKGKGKKCGSEYTKSCGEIHMFHSQDDPTAKKKGISYCIFPSEPIIFGCPYFNLTQTSGKKGPKMVVKYDKKKKMTFFGTVGPIGLLVTKKISITYKGGKKGKGTPRRQRRLGQRFFIHWNRRQGQSADRPRKPGHRALNWEGRRRRSADQPQENRVDNSDIEEVLRRQARHDGTTHDHYDSTYYDSCYDLYDYIYDEEYYRFLCTWTPAVQ